MGGRTYKLERTCKNCGNKISDSNKTGYCYKCVFKCNVKSGKDNPFYGKKHSKETIDNLKIKCKEASKKLWENPEYRNKVLNAVTGLKRSDEFKKAQSERTKKQFNDPEQRRIRSEKMKESWQNGTIVKNNFSCNRSKQEHSFYLDLKEIYGDKVLNKQVIRYINEDTNRKKHLFPDILFPEIKLVVEYHGSFWHADPRDFEPDQTVHRDIKAKEIWKANEDKQKLYESLGYKYYYVWSKDYLRDKIEVINKFKQYYNSLLTKFYNYDKINREILQRC